MLTPYKYGIAATASTMSLAGLIENRIHKIDTEISRPVDSVTIIMPSLNEEKNIEVALSSITGQNIIQKYPQHFELILADSNSKDRTIQIAKPYVNKILNVPLGKLNARTIATNQSNGNIIVAVDADAFYPQGWLNTLLKPFNNPNTVAVHGSNVDYDVPIIGRLFTTIHVLYTTILSPNEMNGGNAAYYKHAFYLSGGFNTNINQLNSRAMSREEEYNFGNRLSRLGKVVYKINAPKVHLGGERVSCRLGFGNKKLCAEYKIGIERFG